MILWIGLCGSSHSLWLVDHFIWQLPMHLLQLHLQEDNMDGNGLGNAFGEFITFLMVVCCISVPLGLWKLIEIIIWIVRHVKVNVI